MLDPGRYFAEAIYFVQYTLAQILWSVNRALLSIAIIAESVDSWITENIGYFVQLLVNALSAPLGGMFILALTALGFWYALSNVVPTSRWVDPSKLFTYGLIAFFFFSSPLVVIDMMEELRLAMAGGIDQALVDGAAGEMFDADMDGTDVGLPAVMPDINADGVIDSFDLVATFMAVVNLDELDSSEFPVEFEAAYFPFGDPSSIDLGDEADQELAKVLASLGIERLFFALFAIPTAIAEHLLRLALTGVAVFLYTGVPFAMLLAFFIYTQAFLGAYLRQFVNLLIETFMSVIIAAIMIGLLAAAAQQGIGLYIGASLITLIVLLWRIKSALKLAAAAFDLFGGSMLTGGVGGMEMARMGRQALTGTAVLAGAALTGGATLAVGGTALASAAALRADGRADGAYLRTDPEKTGGRVRQLKTIAGYALGRSETARRAIEGTHEVRTLARNFRDGEVQPYDPDMLDYLRAGSAMSGFGSSPWLAMRFSPSLRAAYDEISGRPSGNGRNFRDTAYDLDGEPIHTPSYDGQPAAANDLWGQEPATPRQQAYLRQLGVTIPDTLTRGEASLLIDQNRPNSRQQEATDDSDDIPLSMAEHPFSLQGEDDTEQLNSPTVALDSAMAANDFGDGEHETRPSATHSGSVGVVRLEPYNETRRQVIQDVLTQLETPDSLAGQAAHKTLVVYTGARNAALLRAAVSQHSATAVQTATEATADLVAHYRSQDRDEASVLAAFQSGAAFADIREALTEQGAETPLSDDQLSAVADMVLLPQRRLTPSDLVTVIGQEAVAGSGSEQTIAQAIGMGPTVAPTGFGGQTGTVRGVLAGVQALKLSPEELARLAKMIQEGLHDKASAELVNRGHPPQIAQDFVNDVSALPHTMVVPQSTAVQPQTPDGRGGEDDV